MAELGQIYQHYQIIKRVGVGGMGAVYLAEDTRNGMQVALKQLKPELINHDTNVVERFIREGEALRRLNHPNIVKVLNSFQEGNNSFIVMEYVSGGSLRDKLDDVPQLDVTTVLHIGLELADALSRAHHLKILHRDIKPANVLLANDGTPRLTDFGIARLDDQSRVTETGAIMGTFAYMSPETCRSEPNDTAADMWSFGVMLYEMLTGVRPFDREQLPATIQSILNDEPDPIRSIRPDIPDSLAQLIHQLLRKDSTQRMSSARLVGAQIEAILQGNDTPTDNFHSRFDTPPPTNATATLHMMENTPTRMMDIPHKEALPSPHFPLRLMGGVAVLLVLLGIGLFASGIFSPSIDATLASDVTAQVSDSVEPVADNEYMVLVAQFENVGGDTRDIQRFIVDDLTQHLNEDVAFVNLRVRTLDEIVTSSQQADEVAQVNSAMFIIWGQYDTQGIRTKVQIGDTSRFTDIPFDEELLQQTIDAEIEISDVLRQSLSRPILSGLLMLHIANSDIYRVGETIVASDTLKTIETGNYTRNSSMQSVVRALTLWVTDDMQPAIEHMNNAISNDTDNPLLYALRGLTWARERQLRFGVAGLLDLVEQDKNASIQFANKPEWGFPNWLGLTSSGDALTPERFAEAGSLTTNWYVQLRLLGNGSRDLYLGNAEMVHAMVQQSEGNLETLPYLLVLGMYQVDSEAFISVGNLLRQVTDIPHYKQTVHVLEVAELVDAGISSALAHTAIGQYATAQQEITPLQGTMTLTLANLISQTIEGLVSCNLNDESAIDEFSFLIERDMNFAYVLQAMFYRQRGQQTQMNDVLNLALASEQGNLLAPYVKAVRDGMLTCSTFLNADTITELVDTYVNP